LSTDHATKARATDPTPETRRPRYLLEQVRGFAIPGERNDMTHAIRPSDRYNNTAYEGRQLYVIGDPGSTVVKIGVALRPEARLRALRVDQTLRPAYVDAAKLTLLHHELGDRRLEAELHYRFASRRVVGEWFDLGVLAIPLVKSAIRDLRYSTLRNGQ
jgi:hypothetical protein